MELVHHHLLNVRLRPFAQRNVGQDFRRAAQQRRIAIDRGIPGAQPNVFRAKLAAERQPLLIHQRLDRAGVDRALALRNRLEMQRRRHQRFPGTRRRIQDDILLLEQFQDGRFLRWIKGKAFALDVFQKTAQQDIITRLIPLGDQVIERPHTTL